MTIFPLTPMFIRFVVYNVSQTVPDRTVGQVGNISNPACRNIKKNPTLSIRKKRRLGFTQ